MNIEISPSKDRLAEMPDKIVAINPESERALAITRKKIEGAKQPCCGRQHHDVEADEENRIVVCRSCGFVIDAFDYILAWAKEVDRRMDGLKRIEIQRRIAQAEHDDLTRKIKNLRGRLKRAGTSQTEVERNEFQGMRCNPNHNSTLTKLAELEGMREQLPRGRGGLTK